MKPVAFRIYQWDEDHITIIFDDGTEVQYTTKINAEHGAQTVKQFDLTENE